MSLSFSDAVSGTRKIRAIAPIPANPPVIHVADDSANICAITPMNGGPAAPPTSEMNRHTPKNSPGSSNGAKSDPSVSTNPLLSPFPNPARTAAAMSDVNPFAKGSRAKPAPITISAGTPTYFLPSRSMTQPTIGNIVESTAYDALVTYPIWSFFNPRSSAHTGMSSSRAARMNCRIIATAPAVAKSRLWAYMVDPKLANMLWRSLVAGSSPPDFRIVYMTIAAVATATTACA